MTVELFGFVAGLFYVWLMSKQNVWAWPVGIIYILASYFVFFNAKLYAELFSHTVYLILTFYGWYIWASKSQQSFYQVTSLDKEDIWLLGGVNLLVSLSFGFALATLTDNALPYLDSLVATLSFTGMWLQAHKKLENWQIWILVNTISIGLYLSQGLYFYVVLYSLFLVMAFYGYQSWQRAKSYA